MFPDKCFVINAYVGLASQQAEEVALEAFRVALQQRQNKDGPAAPGELRTYCCLVFQSPSARPEAQGLLLCLPIALLVTFI